MSDENEIAVDTEEPEEGVLVEFDIASYPSDYTLSVLHQMWKDGELEIPEFQRNYVWSIQQASKLIESFLLGLPVPQVFLYISDEHKNLIIDGQQRILSMAYFFEGYFGAENTQGRKQVFRLTGLNDKSRYARKTYAELSDSDQRKLKSAVLRAMNIRQLTPEGKQNSVYHIFERLNTGGTPLTPQEIRNCVFAGPIVSMLQQLNQLPSWRKLIGRTALSNNQRDVEMILRVFALSNGWTRYEKPMKEFLSNSMKENRSGKTDKAKLFAKNFEEVCDKLAEDLPPKPFNIRGPINLAAMDSILATCVENSKKLPPDIGSRYAKLVNDDAYKNLIYFNTSDKESVADRMKIARKVLIG